MPAGYSGTPLVTKLGLKPGMRARFINAPSHYVDLLGGIPDGVTMLKSTRGAIDFIHLFVASRAALNRGVPTAKNALAMNGSLWISWPKKSSPMATDVCESDVRAAGLDAGLVDVKICAVDDDWSGLKFVYRVKDRK